MIKFAKFLTLAILIQISISVSDSKAESEYSKDALIMPLAFTINQGQWNHKIKFRANAGGATMWFATDGAYYQFTRTVESDDDGWLTKSDRLSSTDLNDMLKKQPRAVETMMIKASFVGANSDPNIVGLNLMEYKCNYFIGNDQSKWATDVPNYTAVLYKEIYKGIDLKYYGNDRQMEYDFIVSPGADYSQIQIQYEGAKSMTINETGELVVETMWGEVIEQHPVVYQIKNDSRITVVGKYEIRGASSFGFILGSSYDPALPLVIDPVLSYSTFVGGSGSDFVQGIAVDEFGNAYIAGYTTSTDFPVVFPFDSVHRGGSRDVFVTKLNFSGSAFVYSTYIGGSGDDGAFAITVDNAGNAYITGQSNSSDYPTVGEIQTNQGSSVDVIVTKLNSSGNALVYSTYIGGFLNETGLDIAVDNSGSAYITGATQGSFIVEGTIQSYGGGSRDAFVCKLNSSGDSLVYSTYLGGSDRDIGSGIAVDNLGNAYITGFTNSAFNFPTKGAYQANYGGNTDVFVTKINSSGDALVYSTYLGGSLVDNGYRIALDGSGNAYVTGYTASTNFPTVGEFQTDQDGFDAFVTKFNFSGDSLVYSTYIGGNRNEIAYDIAVDSSGNAYITGSTYSTDFPIKDQYQTYQGTEDVFVTKLNSSGNALVYSTYLGGNSTEQAEGIAVDGSGNAYVTGYAGFSDFPLVGPIQTFQGFSAVFVSKFGAPPSNSPPFLTSIGNKSVAENSNLNFTVTATDPDQDSIILTVLALPTGATFIDNGNGTGIFDWTPDFFQSGIQTITFIASDGNLEDSETISIQINNVNQPPVLDSIGNKIVSEGDFLIFVVDGADPDGGGYSFSSSALPAGANFSIPEVDLLFEWMPDFTQAGEYKVTFYITDDSSAVDSEIVIITVNNVNRPPILDPIGNYETNEGVNLNFGVSASDLDGNIPVLFASPLPAGASFTDNGNGTGVFNWTPDFDQAGLYDVTFIASDGVFDDSEIVTINVIALGNITANFDSINFVVGEFAQSSDTILLSLIFEGGDLLPVVINTKNSDWLKIDDSVTELPASLNVSADPTFLDPGIYFDTIFVDGNATNSPLVIPVSLTINNDTLSIIAPTLSIGPNPPYSDILITEPIISIFFSEAVDTNTIPNNLLINSAKNGFIDWSYNPNDMSIVLLVEGGLFEPADTITVTLAGEITDLFGQSIDRSYTLTFYTGPVVYPGDCDNNGIVDERDILPLGLYWNNIGPQREPDEVPLNFEPFPAHFGISSNDRWTPFTAVYADANGSGQVDEFDICGVASNYGMSDAALTKLSQAESDKLQKALKLLDGSVIEAMYNAILECPFSQGQVIFKDLLEGMLGNQTTIVLPDVITLFQNYPNPFNPTTTIEFFLPRQTTVTISIYSLTGRKVRTLIDNESRNGLHSVVWDGRDETDQSVATGIYLYRLKTNSIQINKSMLLIK